ncbi:MAG: selenide, water dikinase SelD [Rhodobacteraceae bacterium]|nr:selenide, water dikinase SelD [Paracoccaceae bacterium]
MQMPLPLARDLVLIGGGHAHALVLRKWGMQPLPGTRLTLINPGPTAPYSGMLPGHIAGHYRREDLDIDLVRLARFAGARLILDRATGIDPTTRQVQLAGRGPVGYDVASLDVGITAEMPDIPGFGEYALGAKPLDIYADRWRQFLAEAAAGRQTGSVAVIGGGVAGVELAMAMAHALRKAGSEAAVTLIEAADDLTGTGTTARRRLRAACSGLGISVLTGASVERIVEDGVVLADGRRVAARFILGAGGARPHRWLAEAALPLQDGFVRVEDSLQVEGIPTLFAAGDCAHLAHAPRPKAGVFAVRAAPVLFHNLAAALSGGRLRAFHPQRRYLKLISLGGRSALAEKAGLTLSGPALWRWKDRIDQRFMDRFRHLPVMQAPALPDRRALDPDAPDDRTPLCGGCGSKIGPETLAGALAALPKASRADILTGPGDDAAVLAIGGRKQVITTDHLRAFTEDTGLLARIAAIHALGDIWAMGAAPQAALINVILPRQSPALAARVMAEILEAAGDVFAEAGAAIVGGHSTLGAETTIGFTVTGLAEGAAITIAGAQPGDALILTRPIGSGTILAAEMAGQADGRDVAALLAVMARPQAKAAAILRQAHAMTDVTGFGLAGHLLAICRASGTGADLHLSAIPAYDGALALADAGIRSTIHTANRQAAPVEGASGAMGILLHDPQTAGGLLAAVAAEAADDVLAALADQGFAAARIGAITDAPGRLRCV